MKILHVGKFYSPARGGIETVIKATAEGLVRAGDSVTVVCSAEGAARADENIAGVRVIRAPSYARWFSQPISPILPELIRRHAADADVVHLHSPNPLAEASTFLLPRNAALIVTYHSDVVRQRALLPVYQPLIKQVLRRARKIIVGTRSTIEFSAHLRGFASKCEVVPYGLDPKSFEPTAAIEAKTQALRREHGRFVLFVGRLVPYKGVEFLIRAAQGLDIDTTHAMNAAKIVIAGDGPLRPELERTARGLGVDRRVAFIGAADDETLAALYRACEILVLPSISKNEAFGMVLLEAMAWGKASIASRLDSGISEVIEDGKTGIYVPPRDPAALRSAIQRLLSDEGELRKMGSCARARFERKFTADRMVESLRKVYVESTAS